MTGTIVIRPKRHELRFAWNMLKFKVNPEDVKLGAPKEETKQEFLSDDVVQELQRPATRAKSPSKNVASQLEDPLVSPILQPRETATS